ncbi:MAG: choice-of-anchor D domain-containing protein, partial [Bradymonadia bacterium]
MNKRIFCLLVLTSLACGDTDLALVPDINIEPGTIEFREGSDTNRSSVTIENLGRRPLQMRNFRLENQSGDGTLSATLSGDGVQVNLNQGEAANDELIELEPEESIQLIVTYEGNFIESELGRVTVQTNDPDEGNVTIPILAGAGGPAIIVSPGTLNFDTVEVGSERSENVAVVNSGLRPLELSRLSVEGSNDFRVSRIVRTNRESDTEGEVIFDGSNNEISYPVSIEPGESILVAVTFAPTTTLPNVTSELLIESNAENVQNIGEETSTVRVNLLANGARACLIASPEVLDFGSAIRVDSQDVETPNQRLLSIESCGTADLRVDRIELETDDGTFRVLELPDVENGEPLFRLPGAQPGMPTPSREIKVGFWPTELTSYGNRLYIYSNDLDSPEVVDLFGRGVDNQCPVPLTDVSEINAKPLDIISLDGSPSMDAGGEVVQWEWTVTERPQGSVSAPVESYADPLRPADGGPADDTSTPEAFFFVDIAGRYTLELKVVDNLGQPSCDPPAAVVTVTAVPNKDLHIELTWQTPSDPDETDTTGTDLDLHLRHQLATADGQNNWASAAGDDGRYDCYYLNKAPNWGGSGVEDNPSLDIDDTNGAGPENITMAGPEVGVGYDI